MTVTNHETTGRTSLCSACGLAIEEALLLKGLRTAVVAPDGARSYTESPGIPTWRTLDRGWGSARCPASPTRAHLPGADAAGSAFKRAPGAPDGDTPGEGSGSPAPGLSTGRVPLGG